MPKLLGDVVIWTADVFRGLCVQFLRLSSFTVVFLAVLTFP
ncbi:hypothetical protein CRENPOLYSF2_2690004 [Crenothrix polyspora]|uniref:Uncharacterized protein n=1 Tax=Crenothrix polyspora TaxID=360316 RepID=A0A1R4H881_9GAMM|nr:hypothetical protein CRENPOLYSF2_2690004 [Crenothrix polyspora]